MSSNSSPLFAVAQMVGITGPAFVAGTAFCFSLAGVPAVLDASSTSLVLQQWRKMYSIGKSAQPPFALAACLGLAYASWTASQRPDQSASDWKGYAAAALFTISIVPFTFAVLGPTNNKLLDEAAMVVDAGKAAILKDSDVRSLVARWAQLNYLRVSVPLTGAILAAWTALR